MMIYIDVGAGRHNMAITSEYHECFMMKKIFSNQLEMHVNWHESEGRDSVHIRE